MGKKAKYLGIYNMLKAAYPLTYLNEIHQSQSFQDTNVIVLLDLTVITPIEEKDKGQDDEMFFRVHVMNKDYKKAFEAALNVRDLVNDFEVDGGETYFESMTPIDDTELEIKRFAIEFKIH